MSRAFEKAGHNSFKDILEGPSSFAFAKGDPTVAVRVINDFTKKTKIKVKGGLVEGKPLDAAGMTAVASIPGKTVLVGQLLGMLTSPARSLAVVLSEIAKKKA